MLAILRRGTFCLFALVLTSLQAEERTYRPKDLLSELLQRSPDIQAARFRFEAATNRPSQLGTVPKPSAGCMNFGVGNPFLRLTVFEFTYQDFRVSPALPFSGELSLASAGVMRDGGSIQQNHRLVVLDVAARSSQIRIELVRHP